MYTLRSHTLALALALAGCGKPSGAKSAADTEPAKEGERTSLAQGATVCLAAVLGMRYPVEDAVREQGLAPVAQCTFADVRLREEGEPGKYVLRYQRIEDSEWSSCESSQQDRLAFLRECSLQMVDDLGVGPSPTAEAAE